MQLPPSGVLLTRCNRAASEIKCGSQFGGYVITAKLHEGRWATTYAGVATRGRDTVAIKLLDTDQKHNPLALDCLRREVYVARLVGRPTAAQVVRTGRTSSGRAFIVSEFVDGVTLETLLGKRMTRRCAAQFLVALAKAVLCTHKAEVIHRDLAPSRIMLRPNGEVCLLGWELAKSPLRMRLAPEFANPMLFAPGYRAPEHARQDGCEASADVFSVGALGYTMLVGYHPFGGQPDALVGRNLGAAYLTWPEIPPQIELALSRALDDRPERRPTVKTLHTLLRAGLRRLATQDGQVGVRRFGAAVP